MTTESKAEKAKEYVYCMKDGTRTGAIVLKPILANDHGDIIDEGLIVRYTEGMIRTSDPEIIKGLDGYKKLAGIKYDKYDANAFSGADKSKDTD